MKLRFQIQPKHKLLLINIWRSLTEWGINFVFSTLPLWFGVIVLAAKDKAEDSFTQSIINNFPLMYSKSELFAYSIAALAPVIYITIKLRKAEMYSTILIFLVALSFIIALISGGLIAVNISSTDYNFISVLPVSKIFFWCSFALLFFAILLNNIASPENQIKDSSDAIREDGEDFARQFRDR